METGKDKLHQKMIDKIKKLLALASSANEHEAALAAEKAQALLAEHNLTMSDVGDDESGTEIMLDSILESDSRPWRRSLAAATAKLYFCSYFFTFKKKYTLSRQCGYIRYDVHSFVGAAHNVEVAKMMFKYLIDTIERLAIDGSKSYPMKERGAYQTSFRGACAGRVSHRLFEKWQAVTKKQGPQASGGLPALYDQTDALLKAFMDQMFGDSLKTKKSDTKCTHAGGITDGIKAGNNVGLDGQIGGATSRHLLS